MRTCYSTTQVNLPNTLAEQVISWGLKNIPDQDIYKDPDEPMFGRETEPHITILYGLYESKVRRVRLLLKDEKPFEITLGKIGIFENDCFDVVKINVHSPDLHVLNGILRDRLSYRNMFPVYSPHITIAYVHKGRGKKFDGVDYFIGKSFVENKLETYFDMINDL
jgi:2'-5' RNA ligase